MVRAVRGGHIQEVAALLTARQEGVVREARPEGDVSRNGTSQHRHRVEDEDAGQEEHGQAEHQDGQTAKRSKHPVQCARSSPSDSAWDRIGEVSQTPEIHREPKCGEEGLRLPLRIPTPLGEPSVVLVAGFGQAPGLLERQDPAQGLIPFRAPSLNVLFRPEEEHGPSGEDDIVPPVRRRHREMHDPLRRLERPASPRLASHNGSCRAGRVGPGS